MKIIRLEAENIKRLRAVDISPDPDHHTVVISGDNAQGKTSVLDAIWLALGGKAAQKDNPQPLREGEASAYARITMDSITVTRKWSGERTTLLVESREGVKLPSPQKLLDSLVGALNFDPLAFASAHPREQVKQLLEVANVGFDPDELEAQRKQLYDERTAVGRDVRRLRGALAELPQVLQGVGGVPDVQEARAAYERAQADWDRKKALREEYHRLQDEINRLTEQRDAVVAEGKAIQISEWEVTNAREVYDQALTYAEAAASVKERERVQLQLAKAEAEQTNLTTQLAELDAWKANHLAAAKMPVEGLSFDDDGLLLNGVPFAQASGAERLKVSLAIALAQNPQIRVIRITDASLLDGANRQVVEEMARQADAQVWLEVVGDGGPLAIHIEDGEVKG